MLKLSGLYTAVITPFNSDEKLDKKGLRRHLEDQIKSGVDGIVVLGTTGESPTLTDSERRTIIEIAREVIPKNIALIVGTGTNCTSSTIELTKMAYELGADAALIVTPYYNKPTQEGIFRHFSTIANAVNLPIIVYNIPGRCVVNITTDTMKRLEKIPQIIAVKESSGNLDQARDVIKQTRLTVLSGDDALTHPMMSFGATGVISVASNIIPDLMKQLVTSPKEEREKLHQKLLPVFDTLFIETNPIPLKTAMNYFGLPAGPCRLPLCEISESHRKLLLNTLEPYMNEKSTLTGVYHG